MIAKSWRRVLLSAVAAGVLLMPAVSQAAPRVPRVQAGAVARAAEPMQWLSRLWHTVTGLWETATAVPTGTSGQGGATANGDSGASIDPDGHHG